MITKRIHHHGKSLYHSDNRTDKKNDMQKIIITAFLLISLTSAGGLEDWDNSMFEQIHQRWRCNFSEIYFPNVTYLGDTRFYLSANLALLAFGDEKLKESAKLASIGLAASMLTTQVLKCAVGRKRPEDPDCSRCDSSFPSGHTTALFTMAYVYGAQYPKLRIPLYALAVSVGLSRIYLGEHYPTDVIAGAVIGTAGGIAVIETKDFIISIGF